MILWQIENLLIFRADGSFLMYSGYSNKCLTTSLERLTYCDAHAKSQQFRWIPKDRILNIITSKCLGVGSKTVGRKLQWLKCEENNNLQEWECTGDSLLRLKNESLHLSVLEGGVAYISRDNGTKSKWTIHGTQNSICSRPYEGTCL